MNSSFSPETEDELHCKWRQYSDIFDIAFQPIVNVYTGECYGFEALLRNYEEAGFSSIMSVFDTAFRESMLVTLDLLLKRKVLEKFLTIPFYPEMKLFYNMDNRTFIMPDYTPHAVASVINAFNLQPGSFCFEVSEKHDLKTLILHGIDGVRDIKTMLLNHKNHVYRIAIDDFGAGFSGMELLYHSEPDYIKIDRFFIAGIGTDSRKKLFVETTVKMAHTLGITVIAEGVETAEEIYECKRLGCDYIQGFFVLHPAVDVRCLVRKYTEISELNDRDQRGAYSDLEIIRGQIQHIETIPLHDDQGGYTNMYKVLELFRVSQSNFFPVLTKTGDPIGVIRECDLKSYVYSPYGKDILKNKSSGNILQFISKIPTAEIRTQVERILEMFSVHADSEGVILTDNGKYVGFLKASSLLKALNEKNIAEARDQNPLTRLPGNNLINRYISQSLDMDDAAFEFVYFDFDNFKPFNDLYGFRQGDRAILMFSDILREYSNKHRIFIGHIGGDDFFAGFDLLTNPFDDCAELVRQILDRFKNDVRSIYDARDKEAGFIIAEDRYGTLKRFPLLTSCAGILLVPKNRSSVQKETVFSLLAELKKKAKQAPDKVYISPLET